LIRKSPKVELPVQSIALKSDSGEADHSVLEELGLMDEPPVSKAKGVKFQTGQRVKVVALPFPWNNLWVEGDYGTVKRVWEPIRERKAMGDGYGVVAVELDVARHPDWKTIYFSERDLGELV
jgi:hypothetical protein